MDSERLLREIRDDHLSGALELTRKAAQALVLLLEELRGKPPERVRVQIERFAQDLMKAQPAMASIRNLATSTLQASRAGDGSALKVVEEFLSALEASVEKIAHHAMKLIPSRSQVMTVSYSSTVLRSFELAKGQGKSFSVFCPESRPLGEGMDLAKKLAQLGIPVVVCADALAPSLVRECDKVLVGGDALAPEGLVNKIGTYPLALAAREAKVPFIALISRQKFLPHFDPHWISEMDPGELLKLEEPVENVRVCNRYFDLTPLRLISQVVTEEGAFPASKTKEVLK